MPQPLLVLASVLVWAAIFVPGCYLWWRISRPGAATDRPTRREPPNSRAARGGTPAGPVASTTDPARPRVVVRG
ncbi:hypothetical protein [Saccharopolyspora sp. CA-218241]|uniref:hypothetical protein n=1 Tax=Saccharopolyspora sp. CA-218241 TaxID=3240027 RepID=UPI003D975C18